MTPTNAIIHLYKDREGFWKARTEWTDPETGEQRMLFWTGNRGAVFVEHAANEIVEKWLYEIGL